MYHNMEAVKLQLITVYTAILTDLDIITLVVFRFKLKGIYFAPKVDEDVKQLLLEYRQLQKFANSVHIEFIICLLKQFVLKNKEFAKTLFNRLSFAVCLTTSKAIAQSWGSYINHHFKTKPNTKGLELENTAAVDKLVFVRLKGPPPGLSLN